MCFKERLRSFLLIKGEGNCDTLYVMLFISEAKSFLKFFIQQYSALNLADKSASLAYRALFAIAPIVILTVSIAELSIFGSMATAGIEGFFLKLFGPESASFITKLIDDVNLKNASVAFVGISVVLMIYAALGFFFTSQRSFLDIFEVKREKKNKVWQILSSYIYSLFHLLSFLFFIISLFVTRYILVLGLELIQEIFSYNISSFTFNSLVTFSILALLTTYLSFTYRFFSLRTISWVNAGIGGLVSSILALLLNNFLGYYFSFSNTLTLYGAASFLVVILLWVYFFSVIIFSGALVAKYANRQ